MASANLYDLVNFRSAQMALICCTIHLEGTKKADFRMSTIQDHSITFPFKAKHAEILHLLFCFNAIVIYWLL